MIWKDKVRGENIGVTIKTAFCELFRGSFDEIKELDEEYIYTSGLQSGENTDRLLNEPRGPLNKEIESTAANSRQNNNYHFNVQLNSSDVDDEKPQLLLSDIYDKSLVKSEYEPHLGYPGSGDFSTENLALPNSRQQSNHLKIQDLSKNILQVANQFPLYPEVTRENDITRKINKQLKSHQYINCPTIGDESDHNLSIKAQSLDKQKKDRASIEGFSRKLKKLNSHEKVRKIRLKSDPKFIFTFSDNLKLANLHHNSLMNSKLENSFKNEGEQNSHLENHLSRLSFFKNTNSSSQKKNLGYPATPSRGKFEQPRLTRNSEEKSTPKINSSISNVFTKVQELVRRPVADTKPKTCSYRCLKKNSFLV